ncbi:hypothetical protein ATPR_3475 [Acetobacter tropicalis NBRC 101654]|uniref:Uncharacterized protein n=1 Tax=Acetobacter tropicalis NBRC 101654 TaxID=749388 RepID=F7VJC6_9PROT|nr:hypothetical protein ATPR_3475 [Acetobacter tropicalis NBRC 101654]
MLSLIRQPKLDALKIRVMPHSNQSRHVQGVSDMNPIIPNKAFTLPLS